VKSLYVAWQTPSKSRAWFPIGRLDADVSNGEFEFAYTLGAVEAREKGEFSPLLAFPDMTQRYASSELFPLFKNRVLDPKRRDFAEYVGWLALDANHRDPIEILSLTGGERQTDSLEVFPKLEKADDNTFRCRFFLHGGRYTRSESQMRLLELVEGEQLHVAVELTNPATRLAVQLQTLDYAHLGWAPRYLVEDICQAVSGGSCEISAKVVRLNAEEAPENRRLLVELAGCFKDDYEPMSSASFTLVGSPAA
jgi:hypothetical protein